jgi:hypothetical protein
VRDTIKKKIIIDNGYKYYVVKDLGKFNKEFVKQEFSKFLHNFEWVNVMNKLKLRVE